MGIVQITARNHDMRDNRHGPNDKAKANAKSDNLKRLIKSPKATERLKLKAETETIKQSKPSKGQKKKLKDIKAYLASIINFLARYINSKSGATNL